MLDEDYAKFDLTSSHISFEHIKWAKLLVTIEQIAEDNKVLIRDLSDYDPSTAIPLLASLLTLPGYHSHCIRFEILVILAVVYCHGRKKACIQQAVRWFYLIGKSRCVIGEDPAEDVFVSLVRDGRGDYRLFNGVWEGQVFTLNASSMLLPLCLTKDHSDKSKRVFAHY